MASELGSAKPQCPCPAYIQNVTGPWLWQTEGSLLEQRQENLALRLHCMCSTVLILSLSRVASSLPDIKYRRTSLIEIHAAPGVWPALGFMAR
jgi:hypothetical protein